jgi:anion-transporting  ArsA/GET3 family ATPase
MEDALFHLQLKQEYEHRMWCEWIKEKEAEEKAYNQQAEQYFKDLEQFEIIQMEKEYREIKEWEELVTV